MQRRDRVLFGATLCGVVALLLGSVIGCWYRPESNLCPLAGCFAVPVGCVVGALGGWLLGRESTRGA